MNSTTCQDHPKPLIVIGATKAGTTSLFALLETHPKISASIIKETNHFCPDLWPLMPEQKPMSLDEVQSLARKGQTLHRGLIQSEKAYLACFPFGNNIHFRAEASPFYLRSTRAAEEIHRHHPDARLIVILRNPVERAYSHFKMEVRDGRVPEPFATCISEELTEERLGARTRHGILESGLYGQLLARYLERFDAKNLLILDFVELNQRQVLLQKLGTFLEIDPKQFDLTERRFNTWGEARNPGLNRFLAKSGVKEGIRKLLPQSLIDRVKPLYYGRSTAENKMDAASLRLLEDYYREDLHLLSQLTGVASDSWISPS
mgnify:CR=1 FL=1